MKGLLALGLLALCVSSHADVFVRDDIITDPAPDFFTICHGNGCLNLGYVSLKTDQWEELRGLFHPMARSAEEERERLRRAIALMEKFVGATTGTWMDKGGTFNGGEGQMDCIDESINTTLYLKMFEKYGLMRDHRIDDRATRGWFIGGWPHTTAVILEKGGNRLWAVDSWFLDNGEPPFILPLETWKSGWEPIR
ncbi:MAG: hypothetical protein HZC23_13015 [Rhodocyclales bacterium]|nr:hypothetical protein [Rhodocyclales bacterium]